MTPLVLTFYAWDLRVDAGPGARPVGDPIAIAACLGESDEFDTSLTDFSQRYAGQSERDYQVFVKAGPIRSAAGAQGRLKAAKGVIP
jgi:Uncharacterized protein conserved in bacteria (DUF2252)